MHQTREAINLLLESTAQTHSALNSPVLYSLGDKYTCFSIYGLWKCLGKKCMLCYLTNQRHYSYLKPYLFLGLPHNILTTVVKS